MTLAQVTARRSRVAAIPHALIRRSGGWIALMLSLALYAAASIAMHQPFRAGGMRLRFFDLRIYHLGALRLMHGAPLYGRPMLEHLGFSYPPFAALPMAPLAWLALPVDELAVTGLNVILLVWMLRRALLLPLGDRASSPGRGWSVGRGWSLAAALAAGAVWLEPVSVTLGYGQIDLLIAALVIFDLSRPDGARGKGIAIGLAAAIKLTPLLFIAYLALSRRGRAAAVAAITFAGSIALSFALLGHDAAAFWLHPAAVTARIGNAVDPADQSLHGAIARLTGDPHPGAAWGLVIAAVAACGLALSVGASRRGDEGTGFSLVALTALLVSPISWSHHWTLAVPALVLLGRRVALERSRALAAATAALGSAGYGYLPEFARDHFPSSRGLVSLVCTDPYPVLAMLVLACCLSSALRTGWHSTGRDRGSSRVRWGPPAIRTGHLGHGLR